MNDDSPTDVVQVLKASDSRSAFVPALLLALAVAGWFGFQTLQLVRERGTLTTGLTEQESQIEQAKKLRDALQKLATGLKSVAQQGNANATVVVEQLRRAGITIDDAQPGESAAP